MKFIKEFQDFMNEAIEQLLKKPVRKHPRWKDKPEPRMEQGKHKKVLCKEAETVGDPSKIRPYSSLTGPLLSLFSLTAFSFRKPKNKRKAE